MVALLPKKGTVAPDPVSGSATSPTSEAGAVPLQPALHRRDLSKLPKAHLHLHFRQSGRQSTIRSLVNDFNASVTSNAKKFCLSPCLDGGAEPSLPADATESEQSWCSCVVAAKKTYDTAVASLAKAKEAAAAATTDEAKAECEKQLGKRNRKVGKTRQKYEALFVGLQWPMLSEDPLAIEAAPMFFSGFTSTTAKQQSVVGGHPNGEAAAFSMLLRDLCEDAAAEGIRWFEVSISLQARREKWLRVCADIDRARADFPRVGVGVVLCISRGDAPEKAEEALSTVMRWAREDPELVALGFASKIVALGLVGNEAGDPFASKFKRCFDAAKELNWPPVPHAGEMTGAKGPAAVLDAISVGARRIGHGFLAVVHRSTDEGASAVSKLRESRVCCEVCPVSNVHLCDKCFGSKTFRFADHPLPAMIEAGIPCCLNGDDPGTFGAPSAHGLVREFEACRDLMGLSDEQLAECARCSFEFAFCPEEVRKSALADITAWLADLPQAKSE